MAGAVLKMQSTTSALDKEFVELSQRLLIRSLAKLW